MRKDKIEDDRNRPVSAKRIQPRLPIARYDNGVMFGSKNTPQHLLHARIVFDNENCAQPGLGRTFIVRSGCRFYLFKHVSIFLLKIRGLIVGYDENDKVVTIVPEKYSCHPV